MQTISLLNDSVTETAGIFEDLGAIEELQANIPDSEICFIAEDSTQHCLTTDECRNTSSDSRNHENSIIRTRDNFFYE